MMSVARLTKPSDQVTAVEIQWLLEWGVDSEGTIEQEWISLILMSPTITLLLPKCLTSQPRGDEWGWRFHNHLGG